MGDIFLQASATSSGSIYTPEGKGVIRQTAYDEIYLNAGTGYTNAGGINFDSSGNITFTLSGSVSNAGHQNIFIFTSASPGAGGGSGIISIQNAITTPTSNPTAGGILYVTGGALTYRGSGGTVTTIAPA
jgi:hypothetical protein